jgi:molybdopterin-guanine dinucleotide biosynthesis protein A
MSADTARPLYGLVLAGGQSTRMKRDKATLAYHGQTQLEWAMKLLGRHVSKVFVSVRPGQNDPVRAKFAQIVDTREGLGPIAGIMAAQEHNPDVAWLVLGCDLPFLNDRTLEFLVANRDPSRAATAFRAHQPELAKHHGLPEPLCTIFEPSSRAGLLTHVASGKDCPRKYLINADTKLLDQPDPRALDNVNTPEEYGSAMATINPNIGMTLKRIKVQYYALLREQAGRSDEALETSARTPRELYEELQRRHPFSLAPEMLRVAINAEFGEWAQPLADGDAVVFIPPVAGG